MTDRNGGTWEDFLDVARASVSAGALALIQIGQSLKKLSAEYSNLIYSIKLGQLKSLTSLKGAMYFQPGQKDFQLVSISCDWAWYYLL